MKAHQRIIREQKESTSKSENLFGAWWESIDRSIENSKVREIDRKTCEAIILEYEWLGCMPAVVWHNFGIFFDGNCGGVVCYGPEYSENLGKISRERGTKGADWSKYGFEGKMILLSRGACVHWAHPHSGSKLIRQSMKMLPEKYEVITATTDEAAGEIGTIYQASGFFYVGSMREQNPKISFKRQDRDAFLIGDKLVSERSMRNMIGTQKFSEVLKRFPSAKLIKQHSKHRYFAFRGSRKIQIKHQKAIKHLIKPYPKRNALEVSRADTPCNTSTEGVGQFHDNAPFSIRTT
jgi:hypothetical protein